MKQGVALGLVLVGLSGLTTSLHAQTSTMSDDQLMNDIERPELRELTVDVDSGLVGVDDVQAGSRGVQVPIWEQVVEISDAEWVRLRFSEVLLASSTEHVRESYLRITSLEDGHEQYLDADSLREWGNTTAYFNGGAVKIEIMASPNATSQVNRVRVYGVQASAPIVGPRSICGSVDDRELSYDNRDARLMPVGCTAWLFSDHGNRMLTAAHCGPAGGDVIQFNVPLSSNGGATRNPPPQDQYPVDNSSVQDSNGGIFIGNDWAYFGVFDNSNTGLSPVQSYGQYHNLAQSQVSSDGRPIRITGYGSTSSPVPASWYLVQKTHVGPLTSVFGNTLQYATDTTGGNSGSAVLDENNQTAIGIHTNAGCNSVGGNQGTSLFNNDLQNALANPQGICAPRSIRASVLFQPTHIQPEGGDEITLVIDNLQGHTVVGLPKMYVSTDGGGFNVQSMIDNGDLSYTGTFGSYYCGSPVSYYFEIEDEESTVVRVPESGAFSTVALDELSIAMEDNFETDQGWLSYTTGGSAPFVRTIPAGHGLGDPGSDADGSSRCFVTSNNNGIDVDNGSVALVSPIVDLSTITNPVLRVSAWMTGTGPDSMKIEFTDDLGISYTLAQSITSTGGSWEDLSFDLSDFVDLNAFFRMRVTVTDAGADTTVEAGIDAFKVSSEVCDDSGCPADLSGDGVLDFFDVSAFLAAYNSMDASADFTGDGSFDFFDVSAFLNAFSAGCP
jgi:V8-like Glu-specific endopeptidase